MNGETAGTSTTTGYRGTDTTRQIDNNFTYHSPTGDQPQRYTALREKAKDLATLINETVPPSREKALALTNLEQAMFWANAGIARNE